MMNTTTFSSAIQQKRMGRKIRVEVLLTVILVAAAFLLTI
ncbi:hypothetical protein C7475_11431 [Chitinophaga sp. S165]|nr:hypothetical protein C7475_11431 [Chitinophaga sp. S165]